MSYWIVSSMHSKDKNARSFASKKWTTDSFLQLGQFYPSAKKKEYQEGDRCVLKVFIEQNFVADFRISSPLNRDTEGDVWYSIDQICEWNFPVNQKTLPVKYKRQINRGTSIKVSEQDFFELLGIRNFTQNLKLNYKNELTIHVGEGEIEELIDSKRTLKSRNLEIIERQHELVPGNIMDFLCRDNYGDLVVVELKKSDANRTIGQLARYITDVKEHYANRTQKVSGLILALDIDEQLIKSARGVGFDVVLCKLTFG